MRNTGMNGLGDIQRKQKAALASVGLGFGLILATASHAAVVGHWTFNEGGGTIAFDASANNNHGEIIGDPTYEASPGGYAIALNGLSGADDWVNFGTPATFDFTTEDFSVEMWVRLDGGQGSNNFDLFGKGGSSWAIGLEWKNGDARRYNVKLCGNSGCGTAKETDIGVANPGTWNHVAFTKSTSSDVRLYLDGMLVSTPGGGLQPIFSVPTRPVRAGIGGGRYFNGSIDEIRVHDVYLSGGEVLAAFQNGPDTNLVEVRPPSSVVPVANSVAVEFISEDRVDYDLESTTSLVTPNWVGTGVSLKGNGTNRFLYGIMNADASKSYRVVVKE